MGLVATKNKLIHQGKLDNNYLLRVEEFNVIDASDDYANLYREWRELLQSELLRRSEIYADNELEYVLYLKHFNELLPQLKVNWKDNAFFEFLLTISGLQEVADAVPIASSGFVVAEHEMTEDPPRSIALPKVPVEVAAVDPANFLLAMHVPRSCYYIEFPSVQALLAALKFSSLQFQNWSANTYPKTFEAAILDLIGACGLSESDLQNLADGNGRIALAGWDPFFQSGTSMMVVVEDGQSISAKSTYLRDNIAVFSNSAKLAVMAENSFDNQHSVFHDPAFIHARQKIAASQNEQLFLFLSDYWLTNLLSARWQILNRRLNEVDARIRIAEILRLIEQSERNLSQLPDITELKQVYQHHPMFSWLMRDLELDNNRVVHTTYGGLYAHPAIDTLPFEKVSLHEKKTYESFVRLYSNRWQEMDPIAFQLNVNGKSVHSRLYVSPISRISEFRELSQIVLPIKEKHRLAQIPTSAAGISLKFKTTLFQPFFSAVSIPQRLQVSARTMDMAPRVDSLRYIHDDERRQDPWSYTRMPVMLEIPTLVLNQGLPMLGSELLPSEYPGLSVIADRWLPDDWLYQLFVSSDADGYSRVGVNPTPLSIMTSDVSESMETDIPSDVYAYLDTVRGYMLHRYLLIEITENRIYAAWRRLSRMKRIRHMLGIQIDEKIFPQSDKRYICNLPEPGEDKYSSYASNDVSEIPEIFKELKKIEFYVSVFENAISFDAKLAFGEDFAQNMEVPSPDASQTTSEPESLDFDQY